MKKILFPFFLLIAFISNAQEVKVKKVTQIISANEGAFAWAEFVPETNYILASTTNFQSLFLIDKNTKESYEISKDAGAGYKPLVSPDGKTITYRSDIFIDNLKYSELKQYNIESKETSTLVKKTRNLSNPSYLANDLICFEGNSQKKIQNSIVGSKNNSKLVQTLGLKPYLISNGYAEMYLPSGEGNYIWVSLSPDETKMVYNFDGKSTFVSDLNGNVLAELGRFHAPKWLSNEMLVGMNDIDNGDITISSSIVSYSLKTKKIQKLSSSKERIEMYPSVSPDGSQIVFQTEKGELYLMNIKLK